MQINIALKLFIYSVLVFIFSGCGSISGYNEYSLYDRDYSSSEKQEGEKPLSKWKLYTVKVDGREYINIPEKNYITLKIWANNRYGGYSGCNGFTGHINIKHNFIQFTEFLSTSKGCPGNPSIETIIFDALKNANNYYIENGHLFLRHDNETLIVYVQDNLSDD
ncbi:heat shock protein HslJ [Dysgonomonas alginatilytica]|uniref:Heat shock protein HslJ n=1 Tax=Dysgonomonas alginatilytica TaxID=1605892 RepID=A0A2V3PN47_9BACT|nr:META domain-containing protein [Dysgonomonas alginatilytica]PXV62468.1 heat shock protein HslJ [Dysgonomonas alginatilytica]